MPSIKELQTFVAVAEAGSFQGAARRLHATPPAISKRISQMETELGVELFARTTRQCQLTTRGRALIPYAQRVLGEVSEIKRAVGEPSSLIGHLRFGVTETIAFSKLQIVLDRIAKGIPQMTVEVEVGFTPDLIRKVRSHELDIACVVAPVMADDLATEPFWEVGMSWIAPAIRRGTGKLAVDDFVEQTVILQRGSRHIPVIEGWFKTRRLKPKKVIMCNSLAAALKMTAAGLGLSFVPIECARHELDQGTVVPIDVPFALPANSFVTLYPVGPLDPALGAVIEVMRDLSTELLKRPSHKAERRRKT
jgi:DNA-binding transcriptional LysR family regulator